jgi:hypothetical protein
MYAKTSRIRGPFVLAAWLSVPLWLLAPQARAAGASDVRAWYADGQVWIIWKADIPAPETYAIYTGTAPFTDTADATMIGRLFEAEWTGGRLKLNASDPNQTYTIPDSTGLGTYTLAGDEGLFVETLHASGAKYYAVAPWGETDVTNSVTAAPLSATYDPTDHVECHAQVSGLTPAGNPYTIYCMWVDGRDDESSGRPDYPVMANLHKNGAPHVFIVSEPVGGAGGGLLPAVWFLHGGDGSAKQSFPGDRREINLRITEGYLVAHDDHLVRNIDGQPQTNQNTWFFGWRKNYDPFAPPADPAPGDTVINYTQRRLLWINEWMIRRLDVDRHRVSVMGHSMGSSGTNQIAKAYPNAFASVCIFNNGFGGPEFPHPMFGDAAMNLPTNLVNRDGGIVRMADLWDMTTNVSPERDLPFTRVFSGKEDLNGTMRWDSLVVANYRAADAHGWGIHLYWDERGHGLEQWNGHWSHGIAANQQTRRDDAATQMLYRSDQTFPAFSDFQGRTESADPGDGDPATGDPWGTWGGYHDWERSTVVDTATRWGVTAYLIGAGGAPVDSCPQASVTADLVIRKPQRFLPGTGSLVNWSVVRESDGDTLQTGVTVVDADGLVRAEDIAIYRDPDRVRIVCSINTPASLDEAGSPVRGDRAHLGNHPNPFRQSTTIHYAVEHDAVVRMEIFDVAGRRLRTLVAERQGAGERTVEWDGRDDAGRSVAVGTYFCRIRVGRDLSKRAIVRLN